MATPLGISGEARDLTFHLEDSCNCCCFGRRVTPRAQVYVNSKGHVVLFDREKADNEREALRRCVSNLTKIINKMAEERSRDKEDLLEEIDRRIVPLREIEPRPLTIDMVRRIRDIILEPASPPLSSPIDSEYYVPTHPRRDLDRS